MLMTMILEAFTGPCTLLKGSSHPQAKQLEKIALGAQLGGYEATRFKNAAPEGAPAEPCHPAEGECR